MTASSGRVALVLGGVFRLIELIPQEPQIGFATPTAPTIAGGTEYLAPGEPARPAILEDLPHGPGRAVSHVGQFRPGKRVELE